MSAVEQSLSGPGLTARFDEKRIDEVFAGVNQCHLAGAAVGIAIDGKPVYRKGFGLANMELPVALSPSTRMRIYSATKHFTCLSYLLLCEDGKAGLDDPVGKHFPEFHPISRRVTMRQIMGNMSGLRDAHGLNFQFCDTQWLAPSSEVIALYRTMDDFDAEPATTWLYNNGGFVVLSHAIEKISGLSLGEFMRQRIFEPVGMHDTLLRRRDNDFVPGSATMHMTSPEGGYIKSYVGGDRSGTGGIVSTVNDMLRWLAHMDAPRVGSAETWRLITTPQKLANGTSTGYGMGLFRDSYRGVGTLHHPGGGMGANAQVLKVPAARLDIAIMVNREDVSSRELSLRVLDVCLPGIEDTETSQDAPLIAGTYWSSRTGAVIQLVARNGQQFVSIYGCPEMPFIPDRAGVLRPASTTILPYKYAITPLGDRQSPSSLRYEEYGNIDELERVAAAKHPDLRDVAGTYHSPAAGFEATISDSGLHTAGRFGSLHYRLESIGQGIWRAKASSTLAPFLTGIVCFDETGFTFSSVLTRSLPFRRRS